MPPPEARQLPENVRARLLDYLKRDARPDEDDLALRHAAEHGMMGGATSFAITAIPGYTAQDPTADVDAGVVAE